MNVRLSVFSSSLWLMALSQEEVPLAGEEVSVAEIKQSLASLKYEPAQTQVFRPVGYISPPSAQAFFKDLSASAKDVTHFFDMIDKVEGPINFDDLKNKLEREKPMYDELEPAILRPKVVLPEGFHMQLCIVPIPSTPDSYWVAKWFTIKAGSKNCWVSAAIARSCCHSTPKVMRSTGREGPMITKYVFENLGGWQARCGSLVPRVGSKSSSASSDKLCFSSLTDDDIDAGFDFRIAKAPRQEGDALKQTRWIKKNLKNDSPIRNWPEAAVERAVAKLSNEGSLAKKECFRPCTLQDIPEWFMDKVIIKFWPQLKKRALMLLGEAGRGKTPVAELIGMAVAEYLTRP